MQGTFQGTYTLQERHAACPSQEVRGERGVEVTSTACAPKGDNLHATHQHLAKMGAYPPEVGPRPLPLPPGNLVKSWPRDGTPAERGAICEKRKTDRGAYPRLTHPGPRTRSSLPRREPGSFGKRGGPGGSPFCAIVLAADRGESYLGRFSLRRSPVAMTRARRLCTVST